MSRLLAPDCEVVGQRRDGSPVLETAQRLQPDVVVLDVNLPNVHSLGGVSTDSRANPRQR